ncbi:hypothetical protein M885DRAFT_537417 [Pelagophyceae sp. CCMP2097]|nr:hypothetical protein M885DRAFT_537417 [Pelagophyceae sp. CCMP2097]
MADDGGDGDDTRVDVAYADGARFVGYTEVGRYEGEGVYHFADGTRYEGNFRNGSFHGSGRMVLAHGVFHGVFKDGKRIDGEYVFNDGLKYAEQYWAYATPADRRLHSEVAGAIAAGASQEDAPAGGQL